MTPNLLSNWEIRWCWFFLAMHWTSFCGDAVKVVYLVHDPTWRAATLFWMIELVDRVPAVPGYPGVPHGEVWKNSVITCLLHLDTDWGYSPSQVHSADPSTSTRNDPSISRSISQDVCRARHQLPRLTCDRWGTQDLGWIKSNCHTMFGGMKINQHQLVWCELTHNIP